MNTLSSLRPFQADALQTLRAHSSVDLALIAPTGSGKGRVIEEMAGNPYERILLICPLIALGRQFQKRLLLRGIPVSCRMGLADLVLDFNSRVWIMSPESLQNEHVQAEIRAWRPTLVVVDEAHCIEEWGDQFRPEYGTMPAWIGTEGFSRTLWMSATFPRTVRNRIEHALDRPLEVQGTYEPPAGLELQVECLPWSERVEELMDHLLSEPDPGIVFTGTRKLTDRLGDFLQVFGRDSIRYHAGLSRDERVITAKRLEKRPNATVVATSAFGMGMDYPQFRWAVLMQPTYSLLGLIQSAGRVARNGEGARARVFWHPEDFQILMNQLGTNLSAIRRLFPLREFLEQRDEAGRQEILKQQLL